MANNLKIGAVVASAVFAISASSANACGPSSACEISEGQYYIAMPEDAEGPYPALFFLHGYGSSGQGALRNSGLVDAFLDRGYAVVAPDGVERSNGPGRSWSFHPGLPEVRDEIIYLAAVRDAVIDQHDVDPDRIMLSGFSIGGSMTSYLACATPEMFSAYAPIGGNFWRPHPTECAGPVRMFHTHGWTDGTVPLEGRVLRGEDIRDPDALVQGDIFHALEIWRQTNECFMVKADSFVTEGPFLRRKWERCAPESALEFALFPGGHTIPKGWADMALDWFEGL